MRDLSSRAKENLRKNLLPSQVRSVQIDMFADTPIERGNSKDAEGLATREITDGRVGGFRKPFTYEERVKLQELCADEDLSLSQMGKIIGRSENGVITEVRINGGRESYNADEAHELAVGRRRKAFVKMSKHRLSHTPVKLLEERVGVLEMQIEILTETIREILDARRSKN